MKEIEFSVMENSPEEVDALRPILDAYEKQYHVHVRLSLVPWASGWADIIKVGLYSHGPDVSEVGTTWVGSLAGMNALRPFNDSEIKSLGGSQAFFDAIWKTGLLPNDPTVWAVPWVSDTHVIYYRRDVLERVGVSLKSGFATNNAIISPLETLQNGGIPYPLALTTGGFMSTHEVCSWIWGAGGDFTSPDGREVTFNHPEALTGFKDYFGLLPFVQPEQRAWTDEMTLSLLRQEQAPLVEGGPWVALDKRIDFPERPLLGVALVPGVPYIGGTSFVIWKHSHNSQEASDFVRFLSTRPHANINRILPARESDLASAIGNPIMDVFLKSLRTGRAFPAMRLWGLIEDSLNHAIASIWADLFASPDQDLDKCLHGHLDPLAERLNVTLGS
jgi:multiple sugar transport system substrate-binding protein